MSYCDWCQCAHEKVGRFCGQACYGKWQRAQTWERHKQVCPICAVEFLPRHRERLGLNYCSRACWRKSKSPAVQACTVCSKPARPRRRTCSPACAREGQRQAASQRMLESNPMFDPVVRKRVSAALKKRGHQPPVRGGNGTGLTRAQRLLSKAFPQAQVELYVKTEALNKRGVPIGYKVDLGFLSERVAVECDGASHASRKAQDVRRDARLKACGWRVLRLSNALIETRLAQAVEMVESFLH